MTLRFSATGMSRRFLVIGALVLVGSIGFFAQQLGLLALTPLAVPAGYSIVYCNAGQPVCWDPVTAGPMTGTVEYACYQPGFPGTIVSSNLSGMSCASGLAACTGANAAFLPVCRAPQTSMNPGANNCPTTHPICGNFLNHTCGVSGLNFMTGTSAVVCTDANNTNGRCYYCDTGATGIDLKINGSDGTITAAVGDKVMLTWTSTGVKDCDTGTSPAPFGPRAPKGTSGSEQFTVTASMTVGIHCSETSITNRKVQDSVAVIVRSSSSAPALCPQCNAVCGTLPPSSNASLSSVGSAASVSLCPAGSLPIPNGGPAGSSCPIARLSPTFCPGGPGDVENRFGFTDQFGCYVMCMGCKTGNPTASIETPEHSSLVAQLIRNPSPFLAQASPAPAAPAVPVCSSTGRIVPTCPAGTTLSCPSGTTNGLGTGTPTAGCFGNMTFWELVRTSCPAGQPVTQQCLYAGCYRKYAADCLNGTPSCYLLTSPNRYLGQASCVPATSQTGGTSSGGASAQSAAISAASSGPPSCPSNMQLIASGGAAGCLVGDPGPNFCPGGISELMTGQKFTLSTGCTQTCFGCAASSASSTIVQCNRNGICDANEGSSCPDCAGNSAACVQCILQFCGQSTCVAISSSAQSSSTLSSSSSSSSSSASSCSQGACATSGNAACKARGLACKPTASASSTSSVYVCQGLCGNGELDPGETCDAGNPCGGTCCTSSCQVSLDPACASCMMSSVSSAGSSTSGGSCPAGSVALPNGGSSGCPTVRISSTFCSGGPGDIQLRSTYVDASGCNFSCTGCATGVPNSNTSSGAGGATSSAIAWKCTKSDEGPAGPSQTNLFARGTTTLTVAPFTSLTDYCVAGDPTAVHEHTCMYGSTGVFDIYHRDFSCPEGWSCSNGACVQGGTSTVGSNATIVGTCNDSDGGINVGVYGDTNGWIDSNFDGCEAQGADYIFESYCFLEYSPQNNTKTYHASAVYLPCPSGTTCQNGACQ